MKISMLFLAVVFVASACAAEDASTESSDERAPTATAVAPTTSTVAVGDISEPTMTMPIVTTTVPATTTTMAPTTTFSPTTTVPPTTTSTTIPATTTVAASPPPNCHPSYTPCLKIVSDYDCKGGSGNGPYYTGRVQVIGYDEYRLDSDGDGVGCENS